MPVSTMAAKRMGLHWRRFSGRRRRCRVSPRRPRRWRITWPTSKIDLSDPDFRLLFLELSERILSGYRILLDEAIAGGELLPCDTTRLARAIGALSGGSLIGWATYRRGTAEEWVREDLATLLDPYRRPSPQGR